ncbi:hypothetical protein [Domibacillus enclensis]|nr:hypothetical protein [Domibacillus enclensis]OXS75818.1 hypothetical protein B1B05_14920 [Domibacillus enclensis]
MRNYLLIDTFDIISIDKGVNIKFDYAQFLEGLLFYEKIYFSVSKASIGHTVKAIINLVGEEVYFKLLDKDIINFFIDDVGYALQDKGSSKDMKLGKFEMRILPSGTDIERNIQEATESRHISNKTIPYINKNAIEISLENTNPASYQGNIFSALSNNELMKSLMHTYFPFVLVSEEIFDSYKLKFNQGVITIDSNLDDESQSNLFIMLGIMGFGILRVEGFKIIAAKSKVNNLSGNPSTQQVLETQFYDLNKTHSNLAEIIEIDELPELRTLNLSFEDILTLRKQTVGIRKLLANYKDYDPAKFKAEYINALTKKNFYLDNGVMKTVRWVVPTVIGIVHTPAGVAVSLAETALANLIEQKKVIRLKNIFEKNNLI